MISGRNSKSGIFRRRKGPFSNFLHTKNTILGRFRIRVSSNFNLLLEGSCLTPARPLVLRGQSAGQSWLRLQVLLHGRLFRSNRGSSPRIPFDIQRRIDIYTLSRGDINPKSRLGASRERGERKSRSIQSVKTFLVVNLFCIVN